ncbi:hypothetical protein [Pontibacter ruber]|uniref:DUF4168 domain-containing protein n=1 Tax=Pontibacter ruber TaxID=1343895 RepID=A0ABW5CXY0_9BACT|nr:hypothetical protein [Pontibacter ruber]
MKKFLIVSILSAGMGLGLMQQPTVAAPLKTTITTAVANVHPTEAKYDKIMEKYANGLKGAFAEKDDKKTVAMVNKINDELVVEIGKIKPELERWVKGLTEQDKEALEQRMGNKAYLKTIFEIMFDPEIGKRIEQNPELKKAIEAGSQRMQALGFEGSEEDID